MVVKIRFCTKAVQKFISVMYLLEMGMHEQYSYCRNIAYISVILWGYVLI